MSFGLGLCSPALETARTSWGQENIIIKHDKPLTHVRGVVIAAATEEPLAGVLVEVYDKPEIVLRKGKEGAPDRTGQRRIAACVTGGDGRFSFRLPNGRYELRSSKPEEWNCTSMIVQIRRRMRGADELVVPLKLAN